VVQQSRGGPAPAISALAAHEHDARSAANAFATGAPFIAVACSTGVGLARDDKDHKPDAPNPEAVRQAKLTRFADDPRDAHRAWKNLKPDEKTELVNKMVAIYGADFAHQFRDIAERGKPDFGYTYWQPNSGPTPKQLHDRGWRRLGMQHTGNAAFELELWVNAAGHTTARDTSTYHFGGENTGTKEPPPPPVCEDSAFAEDFAKAMKTGWPAMAAFEANVERLEANPAGPDAAQIEADIARSRTKARAFITALADILQGAREAEDYEECILKEADDQWAAATDEFTRILQRYNGLKQPQGAGVQPGP
jgi:hypothetical protein